MRSRTFAVLGAEELLYRKVISKRTTWNQLPSILIAPTCWASISLTENWEHFELLPMNGTQPG